MIYLDPKGGGLQTAFIVLFKQLGALIKRVYFLHGETVRAFIKTFENGHALLRKL